MTKITRRNTRQRSVILDELRSVTTHPTAETLFQMVKKRLPSISFATVYRNLNLLRDEGKVLELTCERYRCRYDGDMNRHHHFFCVGCHTIIDLDPAVAEGICEKASHASGQDVSCHRISLYGYCETCRNEKQK